MLKVALAGNPNCGKTTLFNALTGLRQKVGNWPGVTVERQQGRCAYGDTEIEIVDLPGVYSLSHDDTSCSLDEKIACEFILQEQVDVIINIIDVNHLHRNLYLTTQLMDVGIPVVLAANMLDVADNNDIKVDFQQLAYAFGMPLVKLPVRKARADLDNLLDAVCVLAKNKVHLRGLFTYGETIETAIAEVERQFSDVPALARRWLAVDRLENLTELCKHNASESLLTIQKTLQASLTEDCDVMLAAKRYEFIESTLESSVHYKSHIGSVPKQTLTQRLDKLFLNRWFGLPVFLLVMYSMFFFALNVAGAFQDFFDIASHAVFVEGLAHSLLAMHVPPWLTAILANGIGQGLNTTITFIPVLWGMFFFLSLLEDSGYMARAAFLLDRVMTAIGLPGKSFVPMIVGFGCNVPAVMASRTLPHDSERILTVLMVPFMSCSARLAIYALFIAAFFPHGGHNVIFLLYLLGVGVAVLTGFILRRTVLPGEISPLVLELPDYHMPSLATLMHSAQRRVNGFLWRAGKVIVPLCLMIGTLNSLDSHLMLVQDPKTQASLLALLGQWLTPIFSPMGIEASNWPATIGLLTGVLAKEVVVATLNSLYAQVSALAVSVEPFSLWQRLSEAVASVGENFSVMFSSKLNPIAASAGIEPTFGAAQAAMAAQFTSTGSVLAYLIFVLLYFPCVSTVGVMRRELGWRWTVFSIIWTTGLAYTVAVMFYQFSQLAVAPWHAGIWLMSLLSAVFTGVLYLRYIGNRMRVAP